MFRSISHSHESHFDRINKRIHPSADIPQTETLVRVNHGIQHMKRASKNSLQCFIYLLVFKNEELDVT